ncbi:MAG: carbohydrate binding family 9 domain-containing protein [Acidobacteria bacterium]|nr:carbohydrate binding family 9 domain-containing protein [Acidobacteriota bacterium]
MSRPTQIAPALALTFLGAGPGTGIQEAAPGAERPTMAATRVDQAPTVDGDLSDRAWQESEVGTDFMQHEPLDGVPATEQTELRVVFTDSTIYFGITALDANPDAIIAKEMERDSRIFQDDSIILLLDTFHDRRNAYAFETNLNGARTDTLVTDEGRDLNLEWDGIWSVASRRTAFGWVAEIAIPISTLRFDPAAPAWGFNVQRYIAHKREMTHWSGLPREVSVLGQVGSQIQPVHRISMAGELTGLTGLAQSAQLQIKPFAIGDVSEDPRLEADPITDGDGGLDLKWGVTRSLALDLTYNTDFAEVEVDEQQTNLTRFSLYFPEKRDFFLENAGIFDFGPPHREFFRPPVLKAFFSRRVGLDDGQQVPIDWGARLTGRLGGWNIGVLRVATAGIDRDDGNLPANAFTVARLKRNLGRRSTIGAIVTEAAPDNEDANRVVGLDFNYKPTTKFGVGGFWTGSGLSEDPKSTGTGTSADTGEAAYGVNVDYQGRALTMSMDAEEIEENYQPAAGFLLRKNVRHLNPRFQWLPRIERGLVRSWFTEVRYDYYETLDEGELESGRFEISPLGMRMTTEDRWRLAYVGEEENLVEPFEIASGIVIPAGRYEFDGLELAMFSNQSRLLGVRGLFGWGDFYDGTRTSVRLTFGVRASKHVQTESLWVYNDVELPQGAFDIGLFSQRVDFTFTPNLRLNTIVQYNDDTEDLGLNVRLHWIYKPGSDLFVVYNENWMEGDLRQRLSTHRQIAVKFTYLIQP